MILDERGEFADATALNTGAAGSYLIGDVIDLGNAYGFNGQNINDVDGVYLVIQVDTAATSGGSATVVFTLASDAQAAIATDGSATVHWASGAIPVATLIAGYTVIQVALPKGIPNYERYLGILQTTAVAALTAGKINAFLTNQPANWRAYNNAI
jgi:isocitrate dehydrogenase kinase/phosphatase